jgi:hypothetical protein
VGQLIPGPVLVTVPLPVPTSSTKRLYEEGAVLVKVATTPWFRFMVTVQVLPLVLPHPDHELRLHPAAGVAVRFTTVPSL